MTSHGQPDQSRSSRYILKDFVCVSATPELEQLVVTVHVFGFAKLVVVANMNKMSENCRSGTKMRT